MFPSPDSRIYCLLQSTDGHPALAQAVASPELLSADEQTHCARFMVAKRRHDWLLGRWTAKHLVQSYLALTQSTLLSLNQIEVLADDDGAPYARSGDRLLLSLSISHSGAYSFCAVCAQDAGAVGADVEQVETRDLSFVRTFFTEHENLAVEAAAASERDGTVTALWSAKEAVLKTLRMGLRADTRQIEIVLPTLNPQWQRVRVAVQPVLLPAPSSTLSAWVRMDGPRVLTLAILHSPS